MAKGYLTGPADQVNRLLGEQINPPSRFGQRYRRRRAAAAG